MGTLLALSQLRQKRYENAQMGVFIAHRDVQEKQEAMNGARDALLGYEKRLPVLVEELYRPVLGKKLDVATVQEKLGQEIKLTQKKEDFKKAVQKAEEALTQAQGALEEAKAYLLQCEKKNLALDELIKLDKQTNKIREERLLGKVIDELSTHQYIMKTV